jgi:DNA modification methylase
MRIGKEGRNSRIHVNRDPQHGFEQKHRRLPGVTPKSAIPGQGIKANESFHAACCDLVENRNKRSVWTVATQPYPEAHFATFPEDLIKPCILAGAPVGGVVFDPFAGSGTTVKVAQDLGRVGIGLDLKPEYSQMAKKRSAQMGLSIG